MIGLYEVVSWKGGGREPSWHCSKYYSGIYMGVAEGKLGKFSSR